MMRFMKLSFDTLFDSYHGRQNWEVIEIPHSKSVSDVEWAKEYALSHKGHFLLQDMWNGRIVFEIKQ